MSRRRQKRNRELYMLDHPGLFDVAEDDAPLPCPAEAQVQQRLRFMSFGSGSSGNCAYIGTERSGVLIDAGVDNNYVMSELAANSIDIRTISGIILTHDHTDHVKYAYALLRNNKHMKLYATPRTLTGLLRRHNISRRISDYHQPIYKEIPFMAGELEITAFETSHDGTDNVGYAVNAGDIRFVVATDTGTITSRADYYLRQAAHIMLESNYDYNMLRTGPYTERLKARILSTTGHLDNAEAARFVASAAKGGTLRRLFLCHLSDENNSPQTVAETLRRELEACGLSATDELVAAADPRIAYQILPRSTSSHLTVLL